MNTTPFYDASKTYQQNYDDGPFGIFAQSSSVARPLATTTFFDYPISMPFGIPAGPLLNSKFIHGAWNAGFPIAVYKTVRATEYPTHPFPNVIKVRSSASEIHPGDTVVGDLNISTIDIEHDGITNSFAVPSKSSEVWSNDIKKCFPMAKDSVLVVSFMGTKNEGMDERSFIEDFSLTCRKVKETGAPVLEVNLSCPNFGKEGLVCNDLRMSSHVLESLHAAKGNTPLIVKIGYFAKEMQGDLEKLLETIHQFANGVAVINTISAKVTDESGNQILPGSPVRLVSGICGAKIRWAGLEMVERLSVIRESRAMKGLVLIGTGGVTKPEDFLEYRRKGADIVMSATGAMWKPTLAQEIYSVIQ